MKKIAILGSTGSIGTQALELLHESDIYQIQSNRDKKAPPNRQVSPHDLKTNKIGYYH